MRDPERTIPRAIGLALGITVVVYAAALGALLALVAVHPRYRVPNHAEVAAEVVVSVLVGVTDLRGAIAFSSFGVLLYYAVANASALTQPPEQRRYLRALAWTGLVGCVVLVATLPLGAVATGVAVFAAGVALRWWRVRPRPGMNEA